jgi:hypothetical protein
VGFSIAHVSAEMCLSALCADAISRGQQRVSPLDDPPPAWIDPVGAIHESPALFLPHPCQHRRGGALLRPPFPRSPRPVILSAAKNLVPTSPRATARVAPTFLAVNPEVIPTSLVLASLVKGHPRVASLAAPRQFTFRGTASRRWWDSQSRTFLRKRDYPRCARTRFQGGNSVFPP